MTEVCIAAVYRMTAAAPLCARPESSEDSSAPRRRMRRPQQHGSPSQRRRGAQGVRTPTVPWSPCPRPRSASACPASTRPASDVRCRSSVRRPVRPSGVQCLVSEVRCLGACVRHRCVLCPCPCCPRRRVGGARGCGGQLHGSDRSDRRGPTVSATGARPSPQGAALAVVGWAAGPTGAAGCARGSPVGRQVGEVGPPVAGGAQVGRSVRPTTT
jgi:hypothetical protein